MKPNKKPTTATVTSKTATEARTATANIKHPVDTNGEPFRVCARCEGRGYVVVERDDREDINQQCTACGGTGYVKVDSLADATVAQRCAVRLQSKTTLVGDRGHTDCRALLSVTDPITGCALSVEMLTALRNAVAGSLLIAAYARKAYVTGFNSEYTIQTGERLED